MERTETRFNGEEFVESKEPGLIEEAKILISNGVIPGLGVLRIGEDPGSANYEARKKAAFDKIGANVLFVNLDKDVPLETVLDTIRRSADNPKINSFMIYLPLPGELDRKRQEIIHTIKENMDVDGLRINSPYAHPTEMAILEIINEASKKIVDLQKDPHQITVMVMGAKGRVGSLVVRDLNKLGYEVLESEKETPIEKVKQRTLQADIVVSATGQKHSVTEEMIKEGAVLIGVGYPGDIHPSALQKASFYTSPTGGVGLLTLLFLRQNVIEAAKKRA